jgi:lambda repressor-like predicted transcriptional regulator
MKDKELKEFIAKGHILCRVIFEMAGNPKAHVEETLRKYIAAVKEDPDYIFMNEEYAPCEETSDGIWSMFFEAEVLAANFEKINLLCFNLSPASVEILEPESFTLTQKNLTDWYNDIISRIHEVSISLKNLSSENGVLKINLNRSIKNGIIMTLSEPKTIDEISQKVGVDKENLQQFMDALIKEKNIIFDGTKYSLKK